MLMVSKYWLFESSSLYGDITRAQEWARTFIIEVVMFRKLAAECFGTF